MALHWPKLWEKETCSSEKELWGSHWYRVVIKKVSFGIFKNFKGRKDYFMESKVKKLSLSKVSRYLVIVKVIKIRHYIGHINQ